MPEEVRDPLADLAKCNAATPGPWENVWGQEENDCECAVLSPSGKIVGTTYYDGFCLWISEPDAAFIAESREAMPYWINRAVAAEADNAELRKMLNPSLVFRCEDCDGNGYLTVAGSGKRVSCETCGGDEDGIGRGWLTYAPDTYTANLETENAALREKLAKAEADIERLKRSNAGLNEQLCQHYPC